MNIFFYHKQNPSTDVNQDAFSYNRLYVDNMFANITFASNRFPNSKFFLIEEGLNTSSLNLPNLTVIKQNKNLSVRHRDFLKNYFHLCEARRKGLPDGNRELVLLQLERYFYIYESLVSHGIKNFVNLDSDCVILEDLSTHNFEKIGIAYAPFSEDCVASPLMSSTANLDKFLDFTCSFYEGVQQQEDKIAYINSFFNKPRKQVTDMTLWHLFKFVHGQGICVVPVTGHSRMPRNHVIYENGTTVSFLPAAAASIGWRMPAEWEPLSQRDGFVLVEENPDLFVNNLSLDSDDGIHDLGLGTGNWDYSCAALNSLNNGNYHFTTQATQKHKPQGALEITHIKQIFYTEDGPCFEEKDTKKLIKIKSLHFSPGTLKFDIIPFIEEYKKIYN